MRCESQLVVEWEVLPDSGREASLHCLDLDSGTFRGHVWCSALVYQLEP